MAMLLLVADLLRASTRRAASAQVPHETEAALDELAASILRTRLRFIYACLVTLPCNVLRQEG